MKVRIYFFSLLLSAVLLGQTAPAYYAPIDFSLTGNAMKNQLTDLMDDTHNYTVSYSENWEILKNTDLNPENSSNVYLFYGWDDSNAEDDDDLNRDKDATCGNGNSCTDETWNREHVFAKGLDASSSDNSGPTADPHMLRACDVEMNGMKANKLFGSGSGAASYTTGSGYFYPGDRWKGDVARIIMYMYVSYGENWNPNLTGAGANSYHSDMPDIFLQWNAEDPVSEYEIQRNNYVYNQQGNRNPFIDNPYLATVIWGGNPADNFWPDSFLGTTEISADTEFAIYPNPSSGEVYVSGISGTFDYAIYDLSGKILEQCSEQNLVVLPGQKGIYILRIRKNDKVWVEKVIRK